MSKQLGRDFFYCDDFYGIRNVKCEWRRSLMDVESMLSQRTMKLPGGADTLYTSFYNHLGELCEYDCQLPLTEHDLLSAWYSSPRMRNVSTGAVLWLAKHYPPDFADVARVSGCDVTYDPLHRVLVVKPPAMSAHTVPQRDVAMMGTDMRLIIRCLFNITHGRLSPPHTADDYWASRLGLKPEKTQGLHNSWQTGSLRKQMEQAGWQMRQMQDLSSLDLGAEVRRFTAMLQGDTTSFNRIMQGYCGLKEEEWTALLKNGCQIQLRQANAARPNTLFAQWGPGQDKRSNPFPPLQHIYTNMKKEHILMHFVSLDDKANLITNNNGELYRCAMCGELHILKASWPAKTLEDPYKAYVCNDSGDGGMAKHAGNPKDGLDWDTVAPHTTENNESHEYEFWLNHMIEKEGKA